MKLTKNSKGQALIIVLLLISVLLTVVLSVVSSSVTQVAVTSLEENAVRSFSLAEAGVEQALINLQPTTILGQGEREGESYTASVELRYPSRTFLYPKELVSGESATFWLVSHTDDGSSLTCDNAVCVDYLQDLILRWNKIGASCDYAQDDAAVEALVFYDPDTTDGSDPVGVPNNFSGVLVKKFAWDPSPTRRDTNYFSQPGCSSIPTDLKYESSIRLVDVCSDNSSCRPLLLKVRMLYNQTPQPVELTVSLGSLPSQGYNINSTGKSGESTRRVNVFQGFEEPPIIFDAAVFSRGALNK